MASTPSATSVIVPTFREAANIRPLTERVFSALQRAGREGELIIVDDNSQDGIEGEVEALTDQYPVRLVVRRSERGLSGAVLAGFQVARYEHLVVLDADLQHPPEMIPALLDRLDEGECDFVVATRYGAGGSIADRWPVHRRLISRVATLLARPLMPASDPMSGFFALRRETWKNARGLSPIGYKIALELFVKAGCRRPGEVPIRFDARAAGQSKLSLGEQTRYLRHLARLYRHRFPLISSLAIGCAFIALVVIITLSVGTAIPR